MQDRDPFGQFERLFQQATESETFDASRAALATSDGQGRVSVRFVLIKEWSAPHLFFYTHYESRKARDLAENPWAALAFHWSSIGEQVRFEGRASRAPDARSDAYFAKRPRESQLGAWASPQSQPLASREALEQRLRSVTERFAQKPVTRPPFWGGFQLEVERVEFWRDRPGRLHDRILYTRQDGQWSSLRLAP